jgi:hypothetical protein
MTKFKIGDTVEIVSCVDGSRNPLGSIGVITEVGTYDCRVKVDGVEDLSNWSLFESIKITNEKPVLKKMNTQSVVSWFISQGMPDAADQFGRQFSDLDNVNYGLIRGFLHVIYGSGDDEYIFSKIKCDVTTSLDLA